MALFKNIKELYDKASGVSRINAFAATCQIWLESAKTSSELATLANNLAGIKSTPDWISDGGAVYKKKTTEYVNGKKIEVTANFRKYETVDEFFLDYSRKWSEDRYVKAGLQDNLNNFWLCFACLNIGGWATDISYFKKLCGVADLNGRYIFGASWNAKRTASLEFALTKENWMTVAQVQYLTLIHKKPEINPTPTLPANPIPTQPRNWYIGLDAGHGGADPGAVNSRKGVKEKDVTLGVVLDLNKRLINAGYRTFLTRIDDSNIAVNARPKAFNNQKVDFVISIHANAGVSSATGFEAYIYKRGAANSKTLCNKIYNEWAMEFPDVKLRESDPSIDRNKEGNYALVRDTSMPATLIELDFISNDTLAERLKNADYQHRMSKAIFYAINSYVKQQEK